MTAKPHGNVGTPSKSPGYPVGIAHFFHTGSPWCVTTLTRSQGAANGIVILLPHPRWTVKSPGAPTRPEGTDTTRPRGTGTGPPGGHRSWSTRPERVSTARAPSGPDGRRTSGPPTNVPVMHRSRVAVVLIDHPRPRSATVEEFWRAAVGTPATALADPPYALLGRLDGVDFAFQHLDAGEPRVHLDLESDDVAAEVRRLVGLGAAVRVDHGEHVELADPDGLVFCVVPVQTGPESFRAHAVSWSDGEPDWWGWQRGWDTQQEAYLPDREQRLGALLDAVEAAVGPAPRVLDLAGGTGSITLRLLDRFPDASAVLLDVDPVLLRIAEHTVGTDPRVRLVRADLRDPGWAAAAWAAEPFDAVLTATALPWLSRDRLATLCRDLCGLLRPGGLFANADHLPDRGLPELTERLRELADRRREPLFRDGQAESWEAWWARARRAPELADAVAERDTIFPAGGHDRWTADHDQHLALLRECGFARAGLIWRGGADAAFAAVRADP